MSQITNIKYRADFIVRAAETDYSRKLTLPGLLRIFHEASLQSAINLGLSIWHLEKYNASWVLLRKEVNLYNMPVLGDLIIVETFPSGADRHLTYRDFKAFDQHGNLLATASSSWLLMELNERKMMTIPDEVINSIERFFPDPSDCLPRPSGKIPLITNVDYQWKAQVGWFDLDFNHHLNNVTYASWMLNALPESVFKSKKLSNFQIRYTKEALLHDSVICNTQQMDEYQFIHQLTRTSDGADLAFSKSTWI
jgi:medium-chain acyl-[acyl-carrier-protein] hydrolase